MDGLFPLFFLVAMVGAFWLLVLRPAKARARAQQALVDSVSPGSRVLTSAGIIATVVERGDGEMRVEIAPGVVVTVVDQAVARVLTPDEPVASPDTADTGQGTESDSPASSSETGTT